uniref:Uncharacterized protein n=1 Tax=Sphaerodactylus townsendi TaxID=933632 RepID=A0ACB8EE68_9SAUR
MTICGQKDPLSESDQQLDCALDLMRRLPPQQIEKNLSDLIDLVLFERSPGPPARLGTCYGAGSAKGTWCALFCAGHPERLAV